MACETSERGHHKHLGYLLQVWVSDKFDVACLNGIKLDCLCHTNAVQLREDDAIVNEEM